MIWTACSTAVDFRARLRFPRAGDEPPRRFAPAGSHLFRFSRRSLHLALQPTAISTCVHRDYKKTRTIYPFLIDSSCFTFMKLFLSNLFL